MNSPQGGKVKIIDMALSDVRVLAVVASFVLSFWVVYLKQNINLDGRMVFIVGCCILLSLPW
jgi:hypothetical protein